MNEKIDRNQTRESKHQYDVFRVEISRWTRNFPHSNLVIQVCQSINKQEKGYFLTKHFAARYLNLKFSTKRFSCLSRCNALRYCLLSKQAWASKYTSAGFLSDIATSLSAKNTAELYMCFPRASRVMERVFSNWSASSVLAMYKCQRADRPKRARFLHL